MVLKRKTVSKLARTLKVTKPVAKEQKVKATKKAGKEDKLKLAKSDASEDVEEEKDMQIVSVQEQNELSEKDLVAARAKELKSMGAADMKQLLGSLGLKTGTKEDMIKTLLKHESKERAAAREQKAKIRTVVVQKKQELESHSLAELTKLCENIAIKGLRSKEEKVQRLLIHWQENDGVDKALVKAAQEAREAELRALDSTKLEKLCGKIGVDPYVKEVMVERISKQESDKGLYARPVQVSETDASKGEKNVDMVDSLLANEAQRKKERELKAQQEEALTKRRKELKSMSLDELKKRLTKKGLEASGKKDDMVEALFVAVVQDDRAAARQTELKAKSQQDLKQLASQYGLEGGSKEAMVKMILAHEAKLRADLRAFEAKVGEAAEQKKKELGTKTNGALKEMCSAKGLALGGDKEEKIERIVEEIQKEGDLDAVVSRTLRSKRKEELMSMEKPAVVKLCEQAGVDPTVKDVMVERIVAHESEGGAAIAMADAEPPTKKSRSKK